MSAKLNRYSLLFLGGTLFTISFPRSWSLYPLGVCLILGFIHWVFEFKKNYSILKKYSLFVLPPVIYFIFHIVSVVLKSGDFTLLEPKLLFLLLPIFALPSIDSRSVADDLILRRVFIAGTVITILVLIVNSVIVLFTLAEKNNMPFLEYAILHKYWFFSGHLASFQHPTYLSMKVLWALILIFTCELINRKNQIILYFIIFFLSVSTMMLASKGAVIYWVFLAIIFVSNSLRNRHRNLKLAFTLILVLFTSGFILKNVYRINEFIKETDTKLATGKVEWRNFDQRTREWSASLELIREKPFFGHGFTEIDKNRTEKYLKYGWEEEARLNLNSHNQFLETQATFGVLGTILLLFMLFGPFAKQMAAEYLRLYIAFISLVCFFFLFESVLNRQWGIMFFLIFYLLTLIPPVQETDTL